MRNIELNEKHAYLIMVHNEFDLFEILIRALDYEYNDIFIHLDKKVKMFNVDYYKGIIKKSNIYFLENPIDVRWGDYSVIKAELSLLEYSIGKGKYLYYHLLSGVDFPIKSQEYIHSFFKEYQGREFIGFTQDDFNEADLKFKTSYYHLFTKYIKYPGGIISRALNILNSISLLIQRKLHIDRKFDHVLKKGTNWFSITNELSLYILRNKHQIQKEYRNTLCCDEFFIQTLVWNSNFRDKVFDIANEYRSNMRKICWKRGNPYIWQECDLEELRKSEKLFARKFSSKDDFKIISLNSLIK